MNRFSRIVAVSLLIAAFVLMTAALCTIPGCAADQAGRQQQFDDAIRQAEAVKLATKIEIDKRIADVKTVFDQQKAVLEKHIADLEAQLAAKPEAAAQITPKIEAAKTMEAKIEATYNAATGKFEKITADIFREADAKIAALKAQRERLTSTDIGDQIQGAGNVWGAVVPGLPGIAGALILGAIGGIIKESKKTKAVAAAGQEAVGTMSQAIEANLLPWSDEAEKFLKDIQSTAAKEFVKTADTKHASAITLAKTLAAKSEERSIAQRPGAMPLN